MVGFCLFFGVQGRVKRSLVRGKASRVYVRVLGSVVIEGHFGVSN